MVGINKEFRILNFLLFINNKQSYKKQNIWSDFFSFSANFKFMQYKFLNESKTVKYLV